jgi:NADH-quinone oxidoreductase subunit N
VAFLSVAPKAAGVAALTLVFVRGAGSEHPHWLPALTAMSLLSMAVGNVLALPQTDARRLFGYSGVAQIGYALLGVVANNASGEAMTLFFLTSYVFTNMGAFLVIHAVAESGGGHGLDGLRGLASRSPGLAAALLAFLLSLAGIPFVSGFWAKLYVFLAAWQAGREGLVIAGVTLAAVGIYYYLQVLRAAYMIEGDDLEAPRVPLALRVAIGLCLVAVVGFGLWPSPLIEDSTRAAQALLDGAAR